MSWDGREGYKVASQHDRARHVKRGWVGLGPIGGGYKLTRTTFRPRPTSPLLLLDCAPFKMSNKIYVLPGAQDWVIGCKQFL